MKKFYSRKNSKSRNYTYVPPKSIREEEAAVYRKFAITAVLVIVVAIGLYLWGIPLVVEFGRFVNNTNQISDEITLTTTDGEDTTDLSIVAPRLDPLPSIINSSEDLSIAGTGPSGKDIAIYINDEKKVTILADVSGRFEVKDLQLTEGENRVFAKTLDHENESPESNTQIVVLDLTKPEIVLLQPEVSFSTTEKNTTIIGTTEPDAKVIINNIQVIVNATTGDFTREFDLNEGDNAFKITATDKAGNEAVIELTGTYEPSSEE